MRDAAVLVAVGVNQAGKREVLGVSVSLSEQEVHWRTFMESLVARGLAGLELIVSDAHTGLQTARKAVFGGIPLRLRSGQALATLPISSPAECPGLCAPAKHEGRSRR